MPYLLSSKKNGGPKFMSRIPLLLLSFFSLIALATSETTEFNASSLREVQVKNGAGKVTIIAISGKKAFVAATKNKFSDKCELKMDLKGKSLRIETKQKMLGLLSGDDCEVDFEVKVPRDVDLALKLGSGDISIKDIQGALTFQVGSGNVSANGSFKKIDGKAGAGKIDVIGLAGGGELKAGAGNINLEFPHADLKGNLDIRTGSGDTTLNFPKGTKVHTTFKAGTGELTNELGDTPNAGFKVSAKAGSGNLHVKPY